MPNRRSGRGWYARFIRQRSPMNTRSPWAATVARHSPLPLRAAKQALRLSQEVSLQAGLQQERQLFTLLSATEDRREGIDAFLHKRTAEFKGR